jgi:hypothetical protein
MNMEGLFQLRAPRDLLAKLRHDYQRLSEAPNDAYVAFDFFVTAEHILDWIHPGVAGKARRSAERNGEILLQVVSHLATGAKHMIPEDPRHQSVQHADVADTPYGHGTYGGGTYGGRTLVIQLDGAAAEALGMRIAPLDLAKQVLEYWRRHAALR